MRLLDALILIILFTILGAALYILWQNMAIGPTEFKEFDLQVKSKNYSNSVQFYPNMRYKDRDISYSISNSCDPKAKKDATRAFSLISDLTLINFYNFNNQTDNAKSNNTEITVLCSDIAPEPEEEGHFVAGEGGPSEVINTSNYAVILSGKVSLFRPNECSEPNVAIHEIFHALGFDHNNNADSIMYPMTKCSQEIDSYIINEINRLYKVDSASDLAIEKVYAKKIGRYLSFEISIGNIGLLDSNDFKLNVYTGDELAKMFELKSIEIGTKRILTVENLRVQRSSDVVSFEANSLEKELDKNNNRVTLKLEEVEA